MYKRQAYTYGIVNDCGNSFPYGHRTEGTDLYTTAAGYAVFSYDGIFF